ncbi:MAG: class I SAM-dependent methyltransferase [Actinobacteria bacterium]|nr:class I SAM-dependent methyltransferase [Actinomycetota bacterium]
MDDDELRRLLEEQTAYYRARAGTYDLDMAWDSDDPELRALFAPVEAWFAALAVAGEVLELACGTGAWTRRLASRAEHVHAVDVAPEMIAHARRRVGPELAVTFEVADLFGLEPGRTYDLVFSSFLLTHVPPARSARFWDVVARSVAPGGLVAFVDAAPDRHDEEEWLAEGVVRRTLRDGSEHRIVKVFPTAAELEATMAEHGLAGEVTEVAGRFLVGTARPARR